MSVRIQRNLGRLVSLLCLVLVISMGSRAQDVKYNFMPGTDFSKYHTYKWVTIQGASHPNQMSEILGDRLKKRSVDRGGGPSLGKREKRP